MVDEGEDQVEGNSRQRATPSVWRILTRAQFISFGLKLRRFRPAIDTLFFFGRVPH